MTILPTILFLIARILKDTAIKSADNQVPPPVSAALQGIKSIVTLSMAKTEDTQKQWTALIRSTLACILEYSQPGNLISFKFFNLLLYLFPNDCLNELIRKLLYNTESTQRSVFNSIF